jgi:hypothetical protein
VNVLQGFLKKKGRGKIGPRRWHPRYFILSKVRVKPIHDHFPSPVCSNLQISILSAWHCEGSVSVKRSASHTVCLSCCVGVFFFFFFFLFHFFQKTLAYRKPRGRDSGEIPPEVRNGKIMKRATFLSDGTTNM